MIDLYEFFSNINNDKPQKETEVGAENKEYNIGYELHRIADTLELFSAKFRF